MRIGEVSYEDFVESLVDVSLDRGFALTRFVFRDDIEATCKFVKHEKKEPFTPGTPKVIVTYRGPQSIRYYRYLRAKYSRCFAAFRHDRHFVSRRLQMKNVERSTTWTRKAKRFPTGVVKYPPGVCAEIAQ